MKKFYMLVVLIIGEACGEPPNGAPLRDGVPHRSSAGYGSGDSSGLMVVDSADALHGEASSQVVYLYLVPPSLSGQPHEASLSPKSYLVPPLFSGQPHGASVSQHSKMMMKTGTTTRKPGSGRRIALTTSEAATRKPGRQASESFSGAAILNQGQKPSSRMPQTRNTRFHKLEDKFKGRVYVKKSEKKQISASKPKPKMYYTKYKC